jgi:hypothetical protein
VHVLAVITYSQVATFVLELSRAEANEDSNSQIFLTFDRNHIVPIASLDDKRTLQV